MWVCRGPGGLRLLSILLRVLPQLLLLPLGLPLELPGGDASGGRPAPVVANVGPLHVVDGVEVDGPAGPDRIDRNRPDLALRHQPPERPVMDLQIRLDPA